MWNLNLKYCIENIEDFLLIKPRDVFSSFFKETSAVLRLELRNWLN